MRKRQGVQSVLALIALLVLTLAVGAGGGMVTAPNVANWYPTLVKPSFNPPAWLFGPVWTTLYVLMAIAAWRVWRTQGALSRPLLLWLLQLALNFAWSFIFFGAHALLAALIELSILWLALLATLIAFFRVDRLAGWLLVPYLAWVSFAGVLNAAIWRLN